MCNTHAIGYLKTDECNTWVIGVSEVERKQYKTDKISEKIIG